MAKNRQGDVRRGGFTLVEMLVVVFIISILISLLLPAISMAQDRAKAIKCEAQMRQVWLPLLMHSQRTVAGEEGILYILGLGTNVPPASRWTSVLLSQSAANPIPNPPVMICPCDPDTGAMDQTYFDKHTYVLNQHLFYNNIRIDSSMKNNSTRTPLNFGNVVVLGEKKTNQVDYYMECDNYDNATDRQSDYNRLVETSMHGPSWGSNMLFMDGHVGNDLPPAPPNAIDPWDPIGGATGKTDNPDGSDTTLQKSNATAGWITAWKS